MSYVKTQWVNNTTPINDTNLNKIEQGIYDNSIKLETQNVTTANTNLNDYKENGIYYFASANVAPTNIPAGVNGWLQVIKGAGDIVIKQIWFRHGTANKNDYETYVRTLTGGVWSDWKRYTVPGDLYWTKTNHEILSKYAGYFVDGVNGDDSNDGKSQANAFKTLAPVWEAVKQGDMEIRFGLAGGSTYVWDPYIINNLSIHIYCYGTGDVTLQMPNEPIAFYDCHINFRGNENQKLIFTGAQKLYLDSGSADLQYIDMQFQYINWGAGSRIKYSNMRDIMCNYSNMHIEESRIGGTISDTSNITYIACIFLSQYVNSDSPTIFNNFDNCTVSIYGSTKVDLTGANSNGKFFNVTGGQLSLIAVTNPLEASSTLWKKGLEATGCIIVATQARFEGLTRIATTGSSLNDGAICTANL